MVKELRQEGFLAGINAIPLLPFISDTEEEVERLIIAGKEHNAAYMLFGGLTLFGNGVADSKTLFYKFLERYNASLLPRYRQLYGANFYTPFAYQDELQRKTEQICRKHNVRNRILE